MESKASIADVAKLYESELTRLEAGARLTAFIPIFAIRNVREALRLRGTVKPLPA
jgi:hypothetical protein